MLKLFRGLEMSAAEIAREIQKVGGSIRRDSLPAGLLISQEGYHCVEPSLLKKTDIALAHIVWLTLKPLLTSL